MNPFFAYLIKSSISLAIFYCLFRFTMRNDKNHSLNRFLLLGILLVSAIIPFLNIQFFYEEVPLKQIEVIREFVSTPVFSATSPHEIVQPIIETSSFSINPWVAFYLLIFAALLARILFGVFRVTQIIKRAEKRRLQKIVLALVKDLIQPFTFLNKIVLSEKDFNENKDIIVTHEHAHIKQMHALDLMVCEVLCVVHFFNPFMWLLRRDLKLIHEYQADQAVLNKGIDAKKYQLLVLQKSVGERRFAMANHFTQKPILKRLKMMHKKNKKQWNGVKLILFIPIILLLLQAFSKPEILVEKVGEFVPNLIQKDSSEVWLENWVESKMNLVSGSQLEERANTKKIEVLHIVDSDNEKVIIDKNTYSKNNVFIILQNKLGKLLVENKGMEKNQLGIAIESFIKGKNTISNEMTDFSSVEFPLLGKTDVSNGVILYRKDLLTPVASVKDVLKIIGEAYLNVRKEVALDMFGEDYFSLSNDKKKIIGEIVPTRITFSAPMRTTPPPPPPKVKQTQKGLSTSVENQQAYDVIVYADRLEVLGEICSQSELNEKVENISKDKEKISLLAFNNVPKQRLEAVLNELHQVPLKKVSTTILKMEEEPASLAQHKVLVKANGSIDLDGMEYNLNEFETRINEIGKQAEQSKIALEVENDVTYLQTETVKRILRNANIDQVGYSIKRHSVRETNPGTKIGEPHHMFGFAWSGKPDLAKFKREAENFLSGKGNRSLYASITPDENATEEEIDAVKNVLLETGFNKVEISKRRE